MTKMPAENDSTTLSVETDALLAEAAKFGANLVQAPDNIQPSVDRDLTRQLAEAEEFGRSLAQGQTPEEFGAQLAGGEDFTRQLAEAEEFGRGLAQGQTPEEFGASLAMEAETRSPVIPLAELAGEAPEPESKIDRKAAAKRIRDDKDAYQVAIYSFVRGVMTVENISHNLDRLVGALETNNLYDKWRAVDFFDGIRGEIQRRSDGKPADAGEMENFTRLLDTMGFSTQLVEQMRAETMLTASNKEVYEKFIDKIGGSEKTKEKYREILDKGTLSPIEWYLLSLLATQAVGQASTPEEAQKVMDELQVPELELIQKGHPTIIENNKHIGELWEKLKNTNPALYDKLLSIAAKKKDEELTQDDKEIIRGVLAGKVGEQVLDANFALLIKDDNLRFYIDEKYLQGKGVNLTEQGRNIIYETVTKYLWGFPLSHDEVLMLLAFEAQNKTPDQKLRFDFLHEKGLDFTKMSPADKFKLIALNTYEITESLKLNPSEDKIQQLASLMVLAEQLATTLTGDENGNTVPGAFEALINSVALPDFIKDLGVIAREQTSDKVEQMQKLFDLYQSEKRLYQNQIGENLKTESLEAVINRELGLMRGELIGGQARPVAAEAATEIPQPKIEIQSSTLAKEVPDNPDRKNEDTMFQLPEKRAYGVFDGAGGEAAADVASRLARDVVGSSFQALPDGLTFEQAQDAVRKSLLDANSAVYAKSQESPDYKGMGATGSLVYIWLGPNGERKAIIGNVGDSRVYYLRNGKLEQITLDDNVLRADANFFDPKTHVFNEEKARLLQAKMNNVVDSETELNEEEGEIFKKRNVISQGLGNKNIEPRIHTLDLQAGDRLLICSDGISDNLTDIEINDILRLYSDNAEAVKKLTEAAQMRSLAEGHKRHKPDDMTGMIIAIPQEVAVKPTGVETATTAEMVKQINELAAKMTDETSYKANIKQYLEMAAKYEERIPEGEELMINDPALALSSPDAKTRFEQDWERFAQEAAQQVAQKEAALPTKERVEKGRGFGWKLLAGGAAVGLITIALLLGPLKGGKSTTQPAPTMPPPGAPAVNVPGAPQYPDIEALRAKAYRERQAAAVPNPADKAPVVSTTNVVYIGGDLTQEHHFPTVGHALKAQVKEWFGIDVPPGFTWSDAFNDTWNVTVKAQGLPKSADIHQPEGPLNKVKNNFPVNFTDEVKTAAQQNLKAAGLLH